MEKDNKKKQLSQAMLFILLFGVVSLFSDMGCRQVNNVNLLIIFRGQINNTENRAL